MNLLKSTPWKKSHPHLFRELLKALSLIIDLGKYISLRHNSQVTGHISINRTSMTECWQLNGITQHAPASPWGKEAFNEINSMNLRSLNEVSHFTFINIQLQFAFAPVFGPYGLLVLNSIIVIPSLAMVLIMAKCLCIKLVTIVAMNSSILNVCTWSPSFPTNKCR